MGRRNNSRDLNFIPSQTNQERDYWLNKLSGELSKCNFPYDLKPYPGKNKKEMNRINLRLTGELFSKITRISNDSEVRIYVIMVTGLLLLLNKYTSNKDIIIGAPIYKQDIEGELLNKVLSLRIKWEDKLTYKELLLKVGQTIFEANENQNYPIETLLYKLNISFEKFEQRDFPLFDIAILLENIHDREYIRHINLNMIFSFLVTDESIEGVLEYNMMLYEKSTAERIIAHFKHLLEEALSNLEMLISNIEILSDEERDQLLFYFNDNTTEFPWDKSVIHFIEEYAQRIPGKIAIAFENYYLTYSRLNEIANQLAWLLKDRGSQEDYPVGVLLNRSLLMAGSIVAIWKAGGVYIPIDPQYPISRTTGILNDSGAGVVITESTYIDHQLKETYTGVIIKLDKVKSGDIANHYFANPDVKVNMNSLAYVIYTSGSTGNPKGAMLEHIGMINHIQAKINDLQLTEGSIVAQNASHTFDISVWQFFTALTVGGKTIIYPEELILKPDQFISQLIKDNVTILEVVPSYLGVMLDSIEDQRAAALPIKYLLVTGEEVKSHLVKRWFEQYSYIKIVNAYGPTEASDDITHFLMDTIPGMEPIPIGKPIQNLNIYIVDEDMHLLPVGVKGEICVSGIGVGRGYLNDVEKTAGVFVVDPFIAGKGIRRRLYKSGDLGRWLPDGVIEFLGRKDHQTKIRGFRIELGEIESHLSKHEEIKEAVVVVKEGPRGNNGTCDSDKYLCAYLVMVNPGHFDGSKLKSYLMNRLPDYMVPTYFVELEEMPLTPNGKIDRNALPESDFRANSRIMYLSEKMLNDLMHKDMKSHYLSGDFLKTNFDDVAVISEKERAAIKKYSNRCGREHYPLSHSQKMIYYIEKTYPGTSCENDGDIVLYTCELKWELIEKAINRVIYKNEDLRTRIVEVEQGDFIGPAQYICPQNEYTLPYFDFFGKDGRIQLEKWVDENTNQPFNFIDNDLFYFALIKCNEKVGYYMKLHHIISDGGSTSLLIQEIDKVYQDLKAGTDNDELNPSHLQFISDEEEYLKSPQTKIDREFWLKYLLPLPEEAIITSNQKDSSTIRGDSCKLVFSEDLRYKMHQYCRNNKTSLFRLVLSALSIYVSKVTGLEEFIVGTVNHGRYSELHKKMKGMFINFIPIKIKINPDMHFQDFVSQIGEDIKCILKRHGKYPADVLASDLKKVANKDTRYFWNITLIGHPDKEKGSYEMEHISSRYEATPLTIHINCSNKDIDGILELEWVYQLEQFSSTEITQIHQGFMNILTDALDSPKKKLRDIEFLTKKEKNKNLEFPSRTDSVIVEIGERKIDLSKIESCLRGNSDVEEAVVVAKKRLSGEDYLCAYVVSGKNLTEAELNEFLDLELPISMVPLYFVQLEKMPLTLNGKVNKKLLGTVDIVIDKREAKHEEPRNSLEKKLVEIWKEVLGRNTVGINDNFFMIGGDSIKTIQVAVRINKAGYKAEMKDIFQHPTIAELAPLLKKVKQNADQTLVTGIVPLTPIQKYFFENIKIDRYYFNQAVMLYLKERFDTEAVKAVFLKLQEHHDALRMIYREGEEEIVQTIQGVNYPLLLQEYDFRCQPDRRKAIEALESKANEIQASVNLKTGPLMRIGLFHLADGDRLLVIIHHLAVDGVSWRILLEDIETLFQQYIKRKPLTLPLKTDSYKIWAEKLHEYADTKAFLKEKAYWKELESQEVAPIKKDFETQNNCIKDADNLSFSLDEKKTKLLLTKVNEAFGTEINDILLTALGLAIKKIFTNEKILITLEGHGREEILKDVDIKRTVGWFTSVYPALLDFSYECNGKNLSRQFKEIKETLHQVPHKGIGYGILKYLTNDQYKRDIDFKLNPQVSFNYLGQFDVDVERISFAIAKESCGNVRSMKGQRQNGLEVSGMVTGGRLVMSISFNRKQYKSETIEQLLSYLKTELNNIVSYCSSRREREFTPSDFTYKKLSIDIVDRLQREYQIEDIYTLTPMQEGMLFHELYDSGSSAYHIQASYRFHGDWDILFVEKSLKQLVNRYDILRTVFIHKDLERPLQVVLRERPPGFLYMDLRNVGGTKQEKERAVKEFKEKNRKHPVDLEKDILMRLTIFQLDDAEYEFVWSFHHILMDGWCIGVLISEFFELYNNHLKKRTYQLPPVTPYRQYIEWLEERDEKCAKNYWLKYLEGYNNQSGLPKIKRRKPEQGEFDNKQIDFVLKKEKTKKLNELAAKNQVTLNTVINALWGIILGKYCGKKDIVFGVVVSGRPSEIENVESMMGLFINTVPVRIRYAEKMEFKSLLRDVQTQAIESESCHYYPLVKIQSENVLKQHLLDHILVFENYPVVEQVEKLVVGNNGDKNAETFELLNSELYSHTNYDFYINIFPAQQLEIKLKYNANIYERELINKVGEQFCRFIDQVLDNDGLHLDEFKLLSEVNKQDRINQFNDDLEIE